MRTSRKIEIEIFEDEFEFMPNHYYEDGDSVCIPRGDIIYLLDEKDIELAEEFLNSEEEEYEDIQEFFINRGFDSSTP